MCFSAILSKIIYAKTVDANIQNYLMIKPTDHTMGQLAPKRHVTDTSRAPKQILVITLSNTADNRLGDVFKIKVLVHFICSVIHMPFRPIRLGCT